MVDMTLISFNSAFRSGSGTSRVLIQQTHYNDKKYVVYGQVPVTPTRFLIPNTIFVKAKVKAKGNVDLYSAFIVIHHKGAQATPCLPLPRKRSPDGATTDCGCTHLIAAYYSFIDPEKMKDYVGLVG